MLENGTLVHYNRNGRNWPIPWNVGCTPRIHYRGELLDEPLKRLMQELGNAINDSLSESDRIAEAIGEIKRAGYDVFLVLEATIGFNRRDEDEDGEEAEFTDVEEPQEPRRNFETTGKIKFTSQDHRFLRALKIAVDDDNR